MLASVPQIRTSTTGIAPSEGFAVSLSPGSEADKVRRFRRPNRGEETSPEVVERAIPEGMQRPDHTREVIEALQAHPDYELLRADRKRGLMGCVEALIAAADFTTMTTRPTWAKIAEALGVARRSVARYLQQLRTMGLLGVVASGRSAEHAAAGPDGQRINETAVYVLCIPQKTRAIKKAFGRLFGINPQGVDRNVTPPSEAGYYLSSKEVNPRTRARKGFSKSVEQKQLGYSVEQVRWNKHWIPKNRKQQLTAAWRLKTMLPHVLGRMTDRDIAASLRPFFDAKWSVADVHHALDWRPDGTPWPHSGAPETKAPHRVRGWLKYRLSAWISDDNQPLPSKAQLAEEQREYKRRQRELELANEATRRQQAQAVDPSFKRQALARIRQILRPKKLVAGRKAPEKSMYV